MGMEQHHFNKRGSEDDSGRVAGVEENFCATTVPG